MRRSFCHNNKWGFYFLSAKKYFILGIESPSKNQVKNFLALALGALLVFCAKLILATEIIPLDI